MQSLLTLSGRAILLCPVQQQLSGSSAQLLKFWLLEDAEWLTIRWTDCCFWDLFVEAWNLWSKVDCKRPGTVIVNCDIKNSDVLTEQLRYLSAFLISRTRVDFEDDGQHSSYCQHSASSTVVQVMSIKGWKFSRKSNQFSPARRYASAGLCDSDVSVRLSVCPSHAGIVPIRAKAGSWNVQRLIAPWF